MRIADIGVNFGMGVAEIFEPWKPTILEGATLAQLKEEPVDLITFGGGQDIHTSLYNHRNVASYCGRTPSHRDLFETAVFRLAVDKDIPIVGICRGAQLACALSGGFLVQDIIGHATGREHVITTDQGKEVVMSSYHHQMMYPFMTKHKLLAWTANYDRVYAKSIDQRQVKGFVEPKVDPEAVFFPHTRAIAVQGHPEYYHPSHESAVYTRSITNQYLFGGKYPNV